MDTEGRDKKTGRFMKGCKGGPGPPLGSRIARLNYAAIAAVSDVDIAAIVSKLIEKAKAGDVKAATLLFDRFIRKVPQEVEVKALAATYTIDFGEDV